MIVTGRLIDEAFTDSRGVITWGAGSRDGQPTLRASGRQAWCYGCPGIAWTLWEAGRVLGDDRVSAFAARAASSFIAACDSDAEDLGISHGVAGLLLVFDAFSRHADLPGAQHLADRLEAHRADRGELIGRERRSPGTAGPDLGQPGFSGRRQVVAHAPRLARLRT